jgi:hypothetical protein
MNRLHSNKRLLSASFSILDIINHPNILLLRVSFCALPAVWLLQVSGPGALRYRTLGV